MAHPHPCHGPPLPLAGRTRLGCPALPARADPARLALPLAAPDRTRLGCPWLLPGRTRLGCPALPARADPARLALPLAAPDRTRLGCPWLLPGRTRLGCPALPARADPARLALPLAAPDRTRLGCPALPARADPARLALPPAAPDRTRLGCPWLLPGRTRLGWPCPRLPLIGPGSAAHALPARADPARLPPPPTCGYQEPPPTCGYLECPHMRLSESETIARLGRLADSAYCAWCKQLPAGNPAGCMRDNHRLSKSNLAILSQKLRQGGGNPGTAVPGGPDNRTAGQKAADTRKANQAAAGKLPTPAPATPATVATPATPATVHLDLTLVVTESESGLTVTLECPTPAVELPQGWSPNLAWTLRSAIGSEGWQGHDSVTVTLQDATAAELLSAAESIPYLQAAIEADRLASEDDSLARTVSAICAHYLVSRIRLIGPDGTGSREVARGQSYRALTSAY